MHDELDCKPNPAADILDLSVQLADPFGPPGDNAVREISGEWGPLRQAALSDFKEAIADGDAARSVVLVNVLAELALIDLGTIPASSRRGQRALRSARLALARRLIVRHLPDPELSAAVVARLLGVSVRHLHMLFERTGQSFARTVNAERIRLSGQLLLETPPRPVAEIARACGFTSPATFYRLFQIAMKMSPGVFRGSGAQPEPAGLVSGHPPAPDHVTGK